MSNSRIFPSFFRSSGFHLFEPGSTTPLSLGVTNHPGVPRSPPSFECSCSCSSLGHPPLPGRHHAWVAPRPSLPSDNVHTTTLTTIWTCFTVSCASKDPLSMSEDPNHNAGMDVSEYSLNVPDLGSQMNLALGTRDMSINRVPLFDISSSIPQSFLLS